jgi:hypothetical protein
MTAPRLPSCMTADKDSMSLPLPLTQTHTLSLSLFTDDSNPKETALLSLPGEAGKVSSGLHDSDNQSRQDPATPRQPTRRSFETYLIYRILDVLNLRPRGSDLLQPVGSSNQGVVRHGG